MMFNWLSLITGFFYIIMGIFVIMYKFFIIVLEPTVAYAMGGLLMIYGIFRILRSVYRLKNKGNDA